jgi:hypothetical protein
MPVASSPCWSPSLSLWSERTTRLRSILHLFIAWLALHRRNRFGGPDGTRNNRHAHATRWQQAAGRKRCRKRCRKHYRTFTAVDIIGNTATFPKAYLWRVRPLNRPSFAYPSNATVFPIVAHWTSGTSEMAFEALNIGNK